MRFPDLTGSGRADVVCMVGTNTIGKPKLSIRLLSFGPSHTVVLLHSAADVEGFDSEAYFNRYTSSGNFQWDGPHQISSGLAGANRDSLVFMDVDGYVTILASSENSLGTDTLARADSVTGIAMVETI